MTADVPQVSIPADPNGPEYDGTSMARLSSRQRQFVIAMLEQGVNPKASRSAAVKAGFVADYGGTLLRDQRIIDALKEEATKRLAGAALVGVNVMLAIAHDSTHKDQFRAAKELMAINGFTAEQRITVQHIDAQGQAIIGQVRQLAEQMGLDPRLLIEQAGVVDAEFTVINTAEPAENEVDTSDW